MITQKQKEDFLEYILEKADIYTPVEGDIVCVTVMRDKDYDEYVQMELGIIYNDVNDGPTYISKKRKYKLYDWDWSDTTYGFCFKIIK